MGTNRNNHRYTTGNTGGLGMGRNMKTHGGKRKGAGRKPALLPSFLLRLRADEKERKEFTSLLSGDARKNFEIILEALRKFIK